MKTVSEGCLAGEKTLETAVFLQGFRTVKKQIHFKGWFEDTWLFPPIVHMNDPKYSSKSVKQKSQILINNSK